MTTQGEPSTQETKKKARGSTSRSYCWTLNNPTAEELEAIEKNGLRYMIYGHEVGESGTHHLQGYLEAHTPKTISSLKKLPGFGRAHFEIRRGTRDEARAYCQKDGRWHEFGNWEAGGQGRRTDWQQLHAFLKENPDFSKAREMYPEECIKYTHGIRAIIQDIKHEQNVAALDAEFASIELYDWQQNLLVDIGQAPDKRKVIWIVDSQGNRGKTWFAKYLMRYHGSAYLQNGRSSDIAHAYNGERVVTFDFCRSNAEATNYQIIEQIKNGMVFSPKYESTTKVTAIPHVICFSNFEPQRDKLSADRWDIRRLSDESCTKHLQSTVETRIEHTPDSSHTVGSEVSNSAPESDTECPGDVNTIDITTTKTVGTGNTGTVPPTKTSYKAITEWPSGILVCGYRGSMQPYSPPKNGYESLTTSGTWEPPTCEPHDVEVSSDEDYLDI